MKRKWLSKCRLLGDDRREFRTSILVAMVGFIVVSLVFPQTAFEYDGPNTFYIPVNASASAGYFVTALMALLLVINAYRDKGNVGDERPIILAWCVALCLGMFLSLSELLRWMEMFQRLIS